ncbi:hypothetical protein TSUD_172690 [Trifolium subterraneum]|uniref:Reverse transcriptase domain-containing protein n=1 Tax=Trifolium subterraneum TaxID=3900 RepID=A0A2Z6MIT1_TRISU|nr:hypothetical protein TSUD_172690 [Trifolium subterraneum]
MGGGTRLSMIISSFNIRGMGSRVKRRKVRDLVRAEQLDFLALQETKMEMITDSVVHSLWGSNDCGWAFLPAVGNSGGILSMWNKVKASLVFTFIGEGFVGVCLDLVGVLRKCFIVNVYAKCNLRDKRRLWGDLLMSKSGFGDGLWCVLGDFNSVRASLERRGAGQIVAGGHSSEMLAFDLFLNNLGLVDLPIIGRSFTWFHPNGVAMSRLDRILVSPDWFDIWGSPNVWVLARDVADHCPLERLKGIKGVIKEWNGRNYGRVEVEKKRLVEEILALDIKSEITALEEREVVERKKLFENLWKILKNMDAMTFQRSRSKWLKEGDANSRYFHNCIKARHRRNNVVALRTSNGWVEGPIPVREEVVSYFRNHFGNVEWQRPTLDGIEFPRLSQEKADTLTTNFTLAEITEAIKDCDGSKSPGPDGFNFAFIKEFWDLMKHDVRIMFDQFHGNDCLPKSLSSYFLTLIPKVNSPQALGDFRPISLLGCIYKMVAKVLASRLAKVMDELIPKTQSAFLKGRQLVEGVVVVNEVIDFAKKAGKECLIFKVDFEKAYDSVDWSFLDYMLWRFSFNIKWRKWMKACVCSGNMSILVNGSPTEEINIKRGLKQGDPLAPLLFLIVAEGLGALMRMAVAKGRFKPFLVGRSGMPISMLQYADDTLCIGEASIDNLWAVKAILRGFEMVSGLKVNFWKSFLLGVNVTNDFLHMASRFLNCRIGRLPFTYLGLSVGANPHVFSTWAPMLEALKRRLGAWGNRYISLGGRIVLINAVINSIPIFFLSYLKMPVKVWREVVRVQRNFLWGGLSKKRRINWVKWSDICKTKKDGGLGIKDLRLVNLSLLAKWRWKLLMEGGDVWKNVLVAKYGEGVLGNTRLDSMSLGNGCSVWWTDLCRLDRGAGWFNQVAIKKMGCGNTIKFWKDVWVGNQSLEHRFPRLYSISDQQDKLVQEVGSRINGMWRWGLMWRRNFFVWEEDLLNELEEVIKNVVITEVGDSWVWSPNVDEGFSVKSLYLTLDVMLLSHNNLTTFQSSVFKNIWKSVVPSKVSALAWQLFLDRIPTKVNLARRGIIQLKLRPGLILFLAPPLLAADVWYEVTRWLGVVAVLPADLMVSYGMLVGCGGNKKIRRGFSIVWLAYIWVVWRVRNDRVFNNVNGSVEEMVERIQRISWQWYLHKTAKGYSLLYEWIWNPGDCMLR